MAESPTPSTPDPLNEVYFKRDQVLIYLADPEVMQALMASDIELDSTQQAALQELAVYHCQELKQVLDPGDRRRKRPKSKSESETKGAWSTITSLRKEQIKLSKTVEKFLSLEDKTVLVFLWSKELINTCHTINTTRPGSSGEIFIRHYEYTKDLESQLDLGRIRWLFMVLSWRDLIKLIFPKKSGNRLSPNMKEHLQNFLHELRQKSQKMMWYSEQEVDDDMEEWWFQGARVEQFVDAFGEGCLFFLDAVLTPNFLKNKCTFTGEPRDKAFKHLSETLKLQKALDNHPEAQQFGKAIRTHLKNQYTVEAFNGRYP